MSVSTIAGGAVSVKRSTLGSDEYPNGLPVLVIDDEAEVRSVIGKCLRKFKVSVVEAESLGKARERFESGEQFSIVFLDKCLGDGDGVEFFKEVHELLPELAVVIITGQGSGDNAIEAIEAGAFGYIPKPCCISDIRDAFLRRYPGFGDTFEDGAVADAVVVETTEQDDEYRGVKLIANSGVMIRVVISVGEIAKMTRPVLISGPTGTGKEVVARKIHELSSRSSRKFVPVNCGAIPQELVESILFGHVKGAFTSAFTDRKGLFEEADGGTIFLDEITETTAAFQVKLLRVLQEQRISRVGSNQETKLDVRVIASSNRNVVDEVSAGRFREDLYFRLKGSEILLPALKERPEDIMPLAVHFAGSTARKSGAKVSFSAGVVRALKIYDWPGNVRELESVMDSAVQRCNGRMVLLSDLPRDLRARVGDLNGDEEAVVGVSEELRPLADVQEEHIKRVLRHCNGNMTAAAKILGMDRSWVGRLCRRNGWGREASKADSAGED